jgi:hypothetical protein
MSALRLLLVPVLVVSLARCGGGAGLASGPDEIPDEELRLSAEDLDRPPSLTKGELTTAVDEKRYRVAAPPRREFSVGQRTIYLVGRISDISADATIEVRWFKDSIASPLFVSAVRASDSYQFIASFSPDEQR